MNEHQATRDPRTHAPTELKRLPRLAMAPGVVVPKALGLSIVTGGRGTASRTLAVLSAMLSFAQWRSLISHNPARGVQAFKGRKSERFLSYAELARLADTMKRMEEEGVNQNAMNAVRLLLLTGARRGEILQLRWEHIDLERRCLRLADSKTGPKVVPVGPTVLGLLVSIQGDQTSGWVFPATGDGDTYYKGLPKVWAAMRDRADLPGVRLHDLRHTYASFAVSDGGSLFMVGETLGHKQARTTEIYSHLADDPIQALASRTAGRIQKAMNARPQQAKVISRGKKRA